MKAQDVMMQQVVTVAPQASIQEAVQLMLEHKISGLPVIDKTGGLAGIVTKGDFFRRRETGTQHRPPRSVEPGQLTSEYAHISGQKVDEVMTPEVQTVTETTSLEDVVHLMDRYRIKRVPVLRGRELVGIITRANVMRAVMVLAQQTAPATVDDVAIRNRLLTELKKQSRVPARMINVVVTNAVVTISGALVDERDRKVVLAAAENIAGVKKVEDHMNLIPTR